MGGVTFSANHAGTHCKTRTPSRNPKTAAQLTQRGYLAMMGAKWRSLSTAEQDDWATFAATPPETDYNSLGDVYLLTGFQWFSRIVTRRIRTGQVEDLLAPVATPTAAPDTFTLTLYPANGDADHALFGYTDGDFADIFAILQMSRAPGLGSNVQTNRYLNCWEAAVLTSTETEFGAEYFAKFGTTQVDQRFFARLYRQSATGIRSTPSALFTDVVAGP
jgi:hypothetical protein